VQRHDVTNAVSDLNVTSSRAARHRMHFYRKSYANYANTAEYANRTVFAFLHDKSFACRRSDRFITVIGDVGTEMARSIFPNDRIRGHDLFKKIAAIRDANRI